MRAQLRRAVRRASSVVAVVAVVALAVPVEAAKPPQVQGTKCAKVRATRVVKGVSYSCAKVGKTNKWQIVSTGANKVLQVAQRRPRQLLPFHRLLLQLLLSRVGLPRKLLPTR